MRQKKILKQADFEKILERCRAKINDDILKPAKLNFYVPKEGFQSLQASNHLQCTKKREIRTE